ncbi:MAG: hypothetical protein IKX57_04830 [Oscillospiraceae bacterium]|nr:hypothetical protein [Oscillospiraceae bacterium]
MQKQIEKTIFEKLKLLLHADDLERDVDLELPDEPGMRIRPDFYSKSQKIIGEIHAHLGKLKPAQMRKVATDVLKLHLYNPENQYRKYYVVCCQEEEAQLKGNSYLAAAMRKFNIKVLLIELCGQEENDLRAAMKKQNMYRNPAPDTDD